MLEVALQLDKIIALLGPSCQLLDINICIPYPVETNEARQAGTDANRVAQQVSRQNEPHEVIQARLDVLRLAQQHRIDNETPADRQAQSDTIRLTQQQRRQNETPDERQAQLEAVRLTQQERRDISIATPLVPSYSHHCVF